jgi:hypothetical protein
MVCEQAKPGAPAGADEYNAFFYTLVSTDTQVLSDACLSGCFCFLGCCSLQGIDLQ